MLKMRFERSGRGQEPSRGHKFSILENFLSIRDFTSQTLASFLSDLVGVAFVGARPLHLACARPRCRLKAPLGLSLLRCASQTRSHPKPCSWFAPDGANVQLTPSNSQHHDTPNNKTHVIKFRVTAEEKASLELTCKLLNLSLSTFIRRAIHNVKIEKTVIVAGGGEETLTAVSTLLAQCSKVGGNLNQLARHFNSGGADTEQIRAKLLDELADLTAFRLHAEKVLGELYGNAQAYRL